MSYLREISSNIMSIYLKYHLLKEKNMLEKLSKQMIYIPDVIKRLSKKFKSDDSNKKFYQAINS